jgi:hypothetical protein
MEGQALLDLGSGPTVRSEVTQFGTDGNAPKNCESPLRQYFLFLFFPMPFVPRRPPARSPPPAYEMLPAYGDLEPGAPAAQQSSSSPPRLRPLSVSPTLSELELQTFGIFPPSC